MKAEYGGNCNERAQTGDLDVRVCPRAHNFQPFFWFGPKLVTLEFYTNHRIRHLYYLVRVFSGPFLLVLAFSWLILYVGSVSNHTKTVLGLIFSQFFQIEKNIPAKNSLTFHG